MNNPNQSRVEKLLADLRALDGEELAVWRKKAVIIGELDKIGFDFSEADIPFVGWLRKVADGHLLLEALVMLAGNPAALRQVARCPLGDQKRIVDGEPVRLYFRESGRTNHIVLNLRRADQKQIGQVFRNGRILSEAEQVAALVSQQAAKPKVRPIRIGDWMVDPEGQCLRRGRDVLTLIDLKAAVRALTRLSKQGAV